MKLLSVSSLFANLGLVKAREYDSVFSEGKLDEVQFNFKKVEDERAKLDIQ